MLPKENRLHRDAEIKMVRQTGQPFFLPEFTLKYKFIRQPETKIAFVVSNKVSKKATERNLLKRRLRHAIKDFLPNLKPGLQLVVVAKPKSLALDFSQIKKQITFALARIKASIK